MQYKQMVLFFRFKPKRMELFSHPFLLRKAVEILHKGLFLFFHDPAP